MITLLVITQIFILAVVVAIPLFLWKSRDWCLNYLRNLSAQGWDLVHQWAFVVSHLEKVTVALEVAQMPSSSYVAGQVTLTNASQVYNLLALIQSQIDANCPGAVRELGLQATNGNSALIYVGSSKVSSTVYGYSLTANAMRGYSSTYQNVLLGSIFVFSTSPGQKLGVELMVV